MERIALAERAAIHYIRDWPGECTVLHCPSLARPEQEVFEVVGMDGRTYGSVTVYFDGPNILMLRAHKMREAPTAHEKAPPG